MISRVFSYRDCRRSGIGKTAEKLAPFLGAGKIMDARRVSGADELRDWDVK